MKARFFFSVVVHSLIVGFLANCFLLLRQFPKSLFVIAPLFLLSCIFSGGWLVKAPRARSCFHGTILLYAFCASLVISAAYHIPLAIQTIPGDYMLLDNVTMYYSDTIRAD